MRHKGWDSFYCATSFSLYNQRKKKKHFKGMSQLIYFRYEMNCTLKAAITPS